MYLSFPVHLHAPSYRSLNMHACTVLYCTPINAIKVFMHFPSLPIYFYDSIRLFCVSLCNLIAVLHFISSKVVSHIPSVPLRLPLCVFPMIEGFCQWGFSYYISFLLKQPIGDAQYFASMYTSTGTLTQKRDDVGCL